MADLRIVDAPEIPTENITGEEKLPTGGSGNYSISLDSVADYTKTKKDLVDNTTVDGKVNGVRQELDAHIEDLLNPHQVTKGQIGLGNVDNTADADKPVSNSTQAAIISAVAPKADKTYVDNQIAIKANKTDVYTKAETYTKQESNDLVNNSVSTALTPVNDSLELAKRGISNRYDSSLTYNSGERVVLTNGDIVKSNIDGNTNNPNTDMTGWVKTNSASQIFDESGLSQQKINSLIPKLQQFGLKGDGSDETSLLQGAINTCLSLGIKVLDADNLRIKTTDTITINAAIKIINNFQIDCYHDKIGLLCQPTAQNFWVESEGGNILDLDFSVYRHQYYNTPTAVGAQIWNCRAGKFRYNYSSYHYDALQLRANRNTGTTYCQFYLGTVGHCTGGVLIEEDFANGGYVTENTFYDGNFGGGMPDDVRPNLRYHIKMQGSSHSHNNNNVFIRPSLEGAMKNGIIARGTSANTIFLPRFEMPLAEKVWDFDNTCQGMRIIGGFDVDLAVANNLYSDTSFYSDVTGTGFYTGGKFDLVQNTYFEYVDKVRSPSIKSTAQRPRVSVGFKTEKIINHITNGALSIDLSEADVYRVIVQANIDSIEFLNPEILQKHQDISIVFEQTDGLFYINALTQNQLGVYENPYMRQYGQDTYILRRSVDTIALTVLSHATTSSGNAVINHNSVGDLSLNLMLGSVITINANANINSALFPLFGLLKDGESRTIIFKQGETGVSINAFSPAQLGNGKANPVSRANGIDVYEIQKLPITGQLVCKSHYSS